LGSSWGIGLTEYRGGLAYRCLRQAGVWVQDAIHIPALDLPGQFMGSRGERPINPAKCS